MPVAGTSLPGKETSDFRRRLSRDRDIVFANVQGLLEVQQAVAGARRISMANHFMSSAPGLISTRLALVPILQDRIDPLRETERELTMLLDCPHKDIIQHLTMERGPTESALTCRWWPG